MLRRAMMASAGSPLDQQTLLSDTLHSSTIVLEGGRTGAYAFDSLAAGMALSESGKTSGRYYAEVKCTATHSSQKGMIAGIHRGTSNLNNYVGGDSDGWSSGVQGSGASQRVTYHNATVSNLTTPSTNPLNQTARIAVHIGVGVWLSYFGSSGWVGGGDPATDTSPTYSLPVDSATYYLALNPRGGETGGGSNATHLLLVDPGDWLHTPPAGFGVWT